MNPTEHILVVDDEPDLELLIQRKFREEVRENRYIFHYARNGVEALAHVRSHPDTTLVLCDINMPEMDGLTLLSKLEGLNKPALKTIIISAYGDMENIRVAMNRGAFDFITKPIDLEDLSVTIDKALRQLTILRKAMEEHDELVAVQRDLTTAARIQQSILPRTFPPFPDRTEFDLHASMIPAKEVGGDFYDFFFLDPTHLGFVIGDVCGKGMPAAIFMASSRTLLKALATQIHDPGECLTELNNLLARESDEEMFVTIFYGVLDTATGKGVYCNGGHDSPFIIRKSGDVTKLEGSEGLLVGQFPEVEYPTREVNLSPGDTLFLCTDGLMEAMNGARKQFGEERLATYLRRSQQSNLERLVEEAHEEIRRFTDGAPQSDDITMLTLRYYGEGERR